MVTALLVISGALLTGAILGYAEHHFTQWRMTR